jgi:hypothetical protein
MPFGTLDDGGFHRFPLPCHVGAWTTNATLGDESDARTTGTPRPTVRPSTPAPRSAMGPAECPPEAPRNPPNSEETPSRMRLGSAMG